MGYRRLAPKDRYQIEFKLSNGESVRQIALALKVNASTVSRELKRLQNQAYCAESAQRQSVLRAKGRVHGRFKIKDEIKRLIDRKLKKDWSPELISVWLEREKKISVSLKTIYRYVERDKKSGGTLKSHLRILRYQRKDRKSPKYKPYQGLVKNRVPIAKRPKVVEKRSRIGDYERDTLTGNRDGATLLTIVERRSRYVHIACLERKSAELAHRATVSLLKGRVVHTITNDNGTEFAFHERTADELRTKIYFSRSYAAWERGTNENINGLIRQYCPRMKPIAKLSSRQLRALEYKLNSRPRKCLGWRTPYEIYHGKSPGQVLR